MDQCKLKGKCQIGSITEFFKHVGMVNSNGKEICLSSQSRVYIQYKCD